MLGYLFISLELLPPSQPSPIGEGVIPIISPLGETGKGVKLGISKEK